MPVCATCHEDKADPCCQSRPAGDLGDLGHINSAALSEALAAIDAASLAVLEVLMAPSSPSRDDETDAESILGEAPDIEDLSHLETRVYHYPTAHPDGGEFDFDEVEVDGPLTLSVAEDGSHNILCADRVGMTLPPGWVLIESFAKFGHATFPGHPIPSDMVTEDGAQ